ncbi:hypothetical protein vBPaeMUSP25_30B [Pseudomonas phage vB_PaeM_USP_25]|nr:hypothetical protein vBPaeMUSP25_30B [Pseudomonas phage vB_PaeM_USP_25]
MGNSFSGTNIGPGFTVNGQAFQPTGVQRSAQNEQAVQNLMARTPELGSGTPPAAAGFNPGGSRVSVIGDSGRMEDQQRRAFAAASTAHRGAQNGQLTAAQINAMRGLISDERSDRTSRANTEANNAASLQREAMSQAGASSRAALQEGSQNARFSASNQLDQRRLAGEEEARGFTARQAQRIEKLYDQYDQAKPEDRSAIAQQIRELSGGQQQNRFTVVPGGQEIDPTTQQLVTRPAMVLNNQTGEFVQQQGATGPQAPRPGETRGGYRFKGGNPADQNNWEKI